MEKQPKPFSFDIANFRHFLAMCYAVKDETFSPSVEQELSKLMDENDDDRLMAIACYLRGTADCNPGKSMLNMFGPDRFLDLMKAYRTAPRDEFTRSQTTPRKGKDESEDSEAWRWN